MNTGRVEHVEDDEPSPNRSQTDVVVQGIKDMITDGTLRPGSRLPIERDLAAMLNVSRGPLREGVRALAIMGVLETKQGAGTYVTSLEPSLLLGPMSFLVDLHAESDASHLQSVRRVLEMEAAGLAALRMDEEALDEAEATLREVEVLVSATDEHDIEAFIDADVRFHRVIASSSGNTALEALIEGLASRTVRGRLWRAISEEGALPSTHREHLAILQSLRQHDPEGARLRMGTHLLAVQDFMHTHPIADEELRLKPAQ